MARYPGTHTETPGQVSFKNLKHIPLLYFHKLSAAAAGAAAAVAAAATAARHNTFAAAAATAASALFVCDAI